MPRDPQGAGTRTRKVWLVMASYDYEGSNVVAAFGTEKAAQKALAEIHEAKGRSNVYVTGGDEFSVEEWTLGEFRPMWNVSVDASGAVIDRMLMVSYHGEEVKGKHVGDGNTFYGRARTEERATELARKAIPPHAGEETKG